MEDNYIIAKFVRREEIEASGTWIFKEMLNILQHKFGNINKNDCYWQINSRSFYKICEICAMMGFDFERDIECNKNRVTINGINVSFTYNYDSIDDPILFEIRLVYEKPVKLPFLHHICTIDYLNNIPEVKKVIFNDPATIVYWKDGTKTVVKCQNGDDFDSEKGFAMAFLKKCWGNKGNFNDNLRKIMKEAK